MVKRRKFKDGSKKYVDMSVQTSPITFKSNYDKLCKKPVVLIKKINTSQIKKYNLNESIYTIETERNLKMQNFASTPQRQNQEGIKKNNIEFIIQQETPKILKLPRTYSTFVKPINNNEKANSTLADGKIMENSRNINTLDTVNAKFKVQKKVHFMDKPCPKRFKKFANTINKEDFRISIMLDANEISNEQLSTINEHSFSGNSTPNLFEIPDIDFNALGHLSKEAEVQTSNIDEMCNDFEVNMAQIYETNVVIENGDSQSSISEEIRENEDRVNEESSQRNENMSSTMNLPNEILKNKNTKKNLNSKENDAKCKINKKANNITLQLEDVETVITSKSDSSDDERNHQSNNEEEVKPKKSITIIASTVYIHNHFYNK